MPKKKAEAPGVLRVVARAQHASFAPDGQRVCIGFSNKATIVDLEGDAPEVVLEPPKHTGQYTYSPDGRLIAGVTTRGIITFFDAALGGKPLVTCGLGEREGSEAAFIAGGSAFVHGDWEGRLVVWDVASGRALRRADFGSMLGALQVLDDEIGVPDLHRHAWLRLGPELDVRARVPLPDDAKTTFFRDDSLVVMRHSDVERVTLRGQTVARWESGAAYLSELVPLREGFLAGTADAIVWLDVELGVKATRPGRAIALSVSPDEALVAFIRDDDRLVIQRFDSLF